MNNANLIFEDELFSFCIGVICIKTNAKNLFRDCMLFFTPYFSVDKNYYEDMNWIEAILINDIEYDKIINMGTYIHGKRQIRRCIEISEYCL